MGSAHTLGWVSLLPCLPGQWGKVGSTLNCPSPPCSRCTSSWTRTMTRCAKMCSTYLCGAGLG